MSYPLTNSSSTTDSNISLSAIDQRIGDLRREAATIQDVCKQLIEFHQANAMLPLNDALDEYLEYFIEEERGKKNDGAQNADVVSSLEKIKEEFCEFMKILKSSKEAPSTSDENRTAVKLEDIFSLVRQLYALPITGQQIREQVQGIEIGERQNNHIQEYFIPLPTQAASSKMMQDLRGILNS